MNENDELEIELDGSDESVDIEENNYVYINVPEEVIEELEEAIRLRALITETGSQIELAINSSTFVLTAKLKDKNGNLIYTSNGIDLPIESMIINGSYNEQTKKLILTLQSGNTIEISLADLISGLVNQTDLEEALEEALQNYYTKSETYNKEETDSIIAEETKKINSVNSRIDRLYNSLSKGHETGEAIDINDSADLPLAEFGLGGKSKQETTEGKQLLPYPYATTTPFAEANLTWNDTNGKITTSGTPNGYSHLKVVDDMQVQPNTDYRLYIVGTQTNIACDITSGNNTIHTGLANELNSTGFIFNTGEYTKIDIDFKRIYSNQTTSADFYPMLVIGTDTTSTDYEPYTGGQPSPNPNYEQPANSVGDNVNEFDGTYENAYITDDSANIYASSTNSRSAVIKVKPNTTYTISKEISNRFRIGEFSERPVIGTSNALVFLKPGDNLTTYSFTTQVNCEYLTIQVTSEQQENVKMKVEQSTKASPYSPYGMGCASIEKVNKNWLEINENNFLKNCSYVSGANTNEYKLLCNASDMFVNDLKSVNNSYDSEKNGNLIPCNYGETIYFDTGNSLFTKNFFNEFDENLVSLGFYQKQMSSGTYTPTNQKCAYVTFRFGYGTNAVAGTTYTSAPIVSKTPITSYTPHQSKTYDIYTQQPMRSIGEVRDDFVKQDGVWYERHKIGRAILDSEANWSKSNTTDSDSFALAITTFPRYATKKSNYFQCSNANVSTIGYIWFNVGTQIIVRFSEYGTTTLEQFKEWLGNHQVQIVYELAEPLLLPCTNEQSTILDEILEDGTYKEVTHYFSEDEIEPVLDVTYYQDIDAIQNKRLDDLEARLALLE